MAIGPGARPGRCSRAVTPAAVRVPPGLSQSELLVPGGTRYDLRDWRGVLGARTQDDSYHLSWATLS